MLPLAIGALILTGCGRDARLADRNIRDVTVHTVTKYGQVLDTNATPKQVVYVLLHAIVDDYAAGDNRDQREVALDTQFALCAPEEIKRRAAGRGQLTPQRAREGLYAAVSHWAPALGFYRESFKGDFDSLAERMLVAVDAKNPNVATVYLNLRHPHPPEGQDADAVARFGLVKESGYWRIWWVGFERTTRNWKQKPPFGIKNARKP